MGAWGSVMTRSPGEMGEPRPVVGGGGSVGMVGDATSCTSARVSV